MVLKVTVENQTITLSDFAPHPRNYNRHPSSQIERIALSLQKFGQVRSIVTWRGYYLAGHGVVDAALSLGWDSLRADVLPDDYPEHLALAYVAADNELGRLSDPDQEQLVRILTDSRDADEDLLKAIGFSDAEFDQLLSEVAGNTKDAGSDTEPQTNRADELREVWQVETGQLWRLPSAHGGEHRLICGDCTDADVVARGMGGERAVLCFTSPPYADQRDYTNDGNLSPDHLSTFLIAASGVVDVFAVNLGIARKDDAIIPYWDCYIDAAKTAGMKLLSWNVWRRSGGFSIGQITAMFPIEHEFIFVFGESRIDLVPTVENVYGGADVVSTDRNAAGEIGKKKQMSYRHLREMGTVIESPPVNANEEHPAQFPVFIPEQYIAAFDGDIIYEPFAGSGTTIIACENLARQCRAVEISPAYVAVCLQRYADHTGIMPELDKG